MAFSARNSCQNEKIALMKMTAKIAQPSCGHPADEREDAADPEHDREQVVEVLEELQDERAALDLADLVAAVLLEAFGGLFGGQALGARSQ